jgi:hypothetical protein
MNANSFGFATANTGAENSKILNELLEKYHHVEITEPGEYLLRDTILIGSNSSLSFGEGVVIRREQPEGGNSYLITNKGAYTRTYDENISIIGLHLICDGVESYMPAAEDTCNRQIPGLRGHLSFFYIKNLIIRNITALDLPPKSFGIQVCTFENIIIENTRIEGRKDAVHLGTGKNFVIRNGFYKTFDDPIALNAHDYSSANPQLGWIENGLIENCYDYNDEETTGYFCRILAGSWCDWYEGMLIQNSDTVIHGGRLYRALMEPDGNFFASQTPPTHTSGTAIHDGISWVFVQDEVCYDCGCRNITFKDIYIEKDRPVAFSIHFDHDKYSRSVYPGSKSPVQENIKFENVQVSGKISNFLRAVTSFKGFEIKDSNLGGGSIVMAALKEVDDYAVSNVKFVNTAIPEIKVSPKRKAEIYMN